MQYEQPKLTIALRKIGVRGLASMLIMTPFLTFAAGNLIKNGNFENGLEHWKVPVWVKNYIPPDIDKTQNQGPAGSQALRIKPKPGCLKFLVIQEVPIPAGTSGKYIFSYWIKTEGYRHSWMAHAHIPRRVSCGVTPWNKSSTNWTYYSKVFDIKPKDRMLKVHLTSVRSSNTSPQNPGTTWYDNISLVPYSEAQAKKTAPPVAAKMANPLNIASGRPAAPHWGIYHPGEAIAYSLKFSDIPKGSKMLDTEWVVEDFYGKEQASGALKIPAAAQYRLELPPLDMHGYFILRVKIKNAATGSSNAVFSGVIVEKQQGTRDPFFAINLNMGNRFVPQLNRIGFGSCGFYPFPRRNSNGQWKFENDPNRLYATAKLHGEPFAFFWVASTQKDREAWKAGKNILSDEALKPFREQVIAGIERYGDHVKDWVAVNEIDLTRHRFKQEEALYIRKLGILNEELKKRAPDAKLSAIGVSGDAFMAMEQQNSYVRTLWRKLSDKLDGIGYDAYLPNNRFAEGYSISGPEVAGLRSKFLATLDMMGPGKTVSNEESGFYFQSSLALDSPILKAAAPIAARILIIAKSIPNCTRWGWFLCDDTYNDGKIDFGIFRQKNPRPHAAAMAVVCRVFAGAGQAVEVRPHDDIYSYIFTRGGESVTALWSTRKSPLQFRCNLPAPMRKTDMMGNQTDLESGEQVFTLNDEPFYLTGQTSQEAMKEAIESGIFSLPELYVNLFAARDGYVSLGVKNKTSGEITVKLPVLKQSVHLKQGEIRFFDIPRTANKECRVDVLANGVTYSASGNPSAITVPRRQTGSANIFQGIKPFAVLNDVLNLFPLDASSHGMWAGPKDLSAKLFMCYDDKNLYFQAEVTDDIHAGGRTGISIWMQDSIQFAFDTANNALDRELDSSEGYAGDDCEFGIGLGVQGPELTSFKNTGKAAAIPAPRIQRLEDQKKTIYEVAIPWAALGTLKPEAGRVFGFNAVVFDSDRKGHCTDYWMQLSAGITGGKNPLAFRRFVLGD